MLCTAFNCSSEKEEEEGAGVVWGERRVAAISDHHCQPGETSQRPPGDPEDWQKANGLGLITYMGRYDDVLKEN